MAQCSEQHIYLTKNTWARVFDSSSFPCRSFVENQKYIYIYRHNWENFRYKDKSCSVGINIKNDMWDATDHKMIFNTAWKTIKNISVVWWGKVKIFVLGRVQMRIYANGLSQIQWVIAWSAIIFVKYALCIEVDMYVFMHRAKRGIS